MKIVEISDFEPFVGKNVASGNSRMTQTERGKVEGGKRGGVAGERVQLGVRFLCAHARERE